jgi:UDP-N-acetylglucosamine 2-epimerase (non-hydrolysing)
MRVPEEINRKIIDHTADVNLTYSDIARESLLREGLSPDLIIKTGSPMSEVINFYQAKIQASCILNAMGLKSYQFFLVSFHREENIDSDTNFLKFVNLLNSMAENYGLPIIVSTHPRTQKRIESLEVSFHEKIVLMKPLGFSDYSKLQIMAKAVLSDSGTNSEESSILNFPALNLREAQERHEAFEEGSVMMVGLELDRVCQGLEILESQLRGSERNIFLVFDYSMINVSDKVLRIIHSYTDYVKRVVWKQY